MEDSSFDSSSGGEELPLALEEEVKVTINFPEAFFMNPFAVTFPGDLPCLDPISTGQNLHVEPSIPVSPVKASAQSGQGRLVKARPKSNTSSVSSRATSPFRIIEHKQPAHTGKVCKSKDSGSQTKYGPQIHFVDMADKKEAQRIRNTMNSRKHRQNKLDKIRELEEKLANSEKEKAQWHDRAKDLGWRK